jgi:Tol biopolymer transport system component/DNA-binding winged helix-turn-helix (wHTH) protein
MPGKFRFGVFELDCDRVELRKAGVRLRIQEQPFRILTELVSASGEVVTREALRHALWPDETFVDFEHGLNAAVNKLRETLGDTASNPRYVETVPRRGYRFIASIETEQQADFVPTQAKPTRPEAKQGRRPARLASVAALVVLVVLGVVLLGSHRRFSPEDMVAKSLTTYPGRELNPSFSPEGDRVVFSWIPENGRDSDIYIKQIGSEQPQRLTSHPADDVQPAWSPDGRSIAFLRIAADRAAEIMIMPAVGGAERKIGELQVNLSNALAHRLLRWLPDSRHLVVVDGMRTGARRALFRLAVASGERQQITFPPPNTSGDGGPDVSPDGRSLAFARELNAAASEIYVLPLSDGFAPSGEPTQVTHLNRRSGDPLWSADGAELIFVSGPQHLPRFYRMRPDASEQPRPVFPVSEKYGGGVAISHGRSRLAYSHTVWDVNVWKLDLLSPELRQQSFIQSTSLDHLPVISPDGSRVLFVSNRSGVQQLWASGADGSQSEILVPFEGEVDFAAWSPDGQTIVFGGMKDGFKHVFTAPSSGGRPKPITAGASNNQTPSWSRDGEWIYFSSDRSGKMQSWKVPAVAAAEPVPVPTEHAAYRSVESPDGEFLYYVAGPQRAPIFRRSLKTGVEELFVAAISNAANFAVAKAGV